MGVINLPPLFGAGVEALFKAKTSLDFLHNSLSSLSLSKMEEEEGAK